MSPITTAAKDTIHKLRPEAQAIEFTGGGVRNSVFLVDGEVFRFPKEAEGKQVLLYGAAILDKLAGKISLSIPELIEAAPDGSYIILSYVTGKMLSSEEITAFTSEQKKLLAKSIIQCLREINAALSTEEVKQLVQKYIPWQVAEDEFYKSIVSRNTKSKYHRLYVSCYDKYLQRQKEVGELQEMVVYGDFHYGNMLFNDKEEMTGLIDFDDVNIGTIVTELRQIYRIGADVVESIISDLGDEFGVFNLELVKLHAIIHEVWVLMRTEGKEPPEDGRDEVAKQLLSQWLGKNWSKM